MMDKDRENECFPLLEFPLLPDFLFNMEVFQGNHRIKYTIHINYTADF